MFSIVIPTCNRPFLLKKCLDALHPNVQKVDFDYEIIVSDDSHDEETKLLIEKEYDWVKWVKGPRNGIGANRNNGAKFAKKDWIIFIDDDVIPSSKILNIYLKSIELYPNCLAFEGAIHADNLELFKMDNIECPVNMTGGHFWTANVCINRHLFFEIKGFDENLKYFNEDQDIYIELLSKTSIPFIKDAIVIHPVRIISLKKRMQKAKLRYRDYVLFKRKRYSNLQVISYSYKLHFSSVIHNLKRKKWNSVIFHLYFLSWTIPAYHFKNSLSWRR